MDYRKQVGYLKGLCSGLTLPEDKPEAKLMAAVIDTLEAMADAISDTRDDVAELEDDLQTLSDEVGEMDAISEDMERLEEYLEELGDAMSGLAEMFKEPDERPPIRLFGSDGDLDDDLDDEDDIYLYDEEDGEEDVEIYAVCPSCGAHVSVDDENIVIEKKKGK